jgi:hypothetical protein
MSLDLLSQDKG